MSNPIRSLALSLSLPLSLSLSVFPSLGPAHQACCLDVVHLAHSHSSAFPLISVSLYLCHPGHISLSAVSPPRGWWFAPVPYYYTHSPPVYTTHIPVLSMTLDFPLSLMTSSHAATFRAHAR